MGRQPTPPPLQLRHPIHVHGLSRLGQIPHRLARAHGDESPPTAPPLRALVQPGHPDPRPAPRHRRHATNDNAANPPRRGGHRLDAARRRAERRRAGDGHVPESGGAGAGHGAEHVGVSVSRVWVSDACFWGGRGGQDV